MESGLTLGLGPPAPACGSAIACLIFCRRRGGPGFVFAGGHQLARQSADPKNNSSAGKDSEEDLCFHVSRYS